MEYTWRDLLNTFLRSNLVILDGETIKDRWHPVEHEHNDKPEDRYYIVRDYPQMNLLILKSVI